MPAQIVCCNVGLNLTTFIAQSIYSISASAISTVITSPSCHFTPCLTASVAFAVARQVSTRGPGGASRGNPARVPAHGLLPPSGGRACGGRGGTATDSLQRGGSNARRHIGRVGARTTRDKHGDWCEEKHRASRHRKGRRTSRRRRRGAQTGCRRATSDGSTRARDGAASRIAARHVHVMYTSCTRHVHVNRGPRSLQGCP